MNEEEIDAAYQILYLDDLSKKKETKTGHGNETSQSSGPEIVLGRTVYRLSSLCSVPWPKTKLATDLSKKFARHTANARKTKEKLKIALDSLNDVKGTTLNYEKLLQRLW